MKIFTALVVVLLLATAQAYWDVGHMLTAAVAQIRLERDNPDAFRRFSEVVESINFLCDNRTHNFIEAAVWPDDLKEKKYKMNLWDSWHFSDTPFVVDTVSPTINYTESVLSSIHAVETAGEILKKNIDRPSAEKALYARYLIHLAGDIHQPLHSVALFNKTYPRGDIGGNREKVILLNGTERVLHQFWDSGAFLFQNDTWNLIRPMTPQNRSALFQVAHSFMKQFENDVQQQGRIIDPVVWAQESFIIAQEVVYPHIQKTNKVDQYYSDLTFRTLRRQVVKGGLRLANFIKDIYSAENLKKAKTEAPTLQAPHRDHSMDFQKKAKRIIQKLFHMKEVLHPDCENDNIVIEDN